MNRKRSFKQEQNAILDPSTIPHNSVDKIALMHRLMEQKIQIKGVNIAFLRRVIMLRRIL